LVLLEWQKLKRLTTKTVVEDLEHILLVVGVSDSIAILKIALEISTKF
jgi:hypothetical protein